ncbi:MAG: hypothetical protein QXT43_01130 [Candidatus Micrarchaeaceae archaeon]
MAKIRFEIESKDAVNLSQGRSFIPEVKEFLEKYKGLIELIGEIKNDADSTEADLSKYLNSKGNSGKQQIMKLLSDFRSEVNELNVDYESEAKKQAYALLEPKLKEAKKLAPNDFDGMRRLLERTASELNQGFSKLDTEGKLKQLQEAEKALEERAKDIEHEAEQFESKHKHAGGGESGLEGYLARALHELNTNWGGKSVNEQYDKLIKTAIGYVQSADKSAKDLLDLRYTAQQAEAYLIAATVIGSIYKEFHGVGKKPDTAGISNEVKALEKALEDKINSVKTVDGQQNSVSAQQAAEQENPNPSKSRNGNVGAKKAVKHELVPNLTAGIIAGETIEKIMQRRYKTIMKAIEHISAASTQEEISKVNAMVLDYNAEVHGLGNFRGEAGLAEGSKAAIEQYKKGLNGAVIAKAKEIGLGVTYVQLSNEHKERATKHIEALYTSKEEEYEHVISEYKKDVVPIIARMLNIDAEKLQELLEEELEEMVKRHKAIATALRGGKKELKGAARTEAQVTQQVPQLGGATSTN